MKSVPAVGWAIVTQHGEIIVRTVTGTDRDTMLLFLSALPTAPMPADYWTEQTVKTVFKHFAEQTNVRLARVTIKER